MRRKVIWLLSCSAAAVIIAIAFSFSSQHDRQAELTVAAAEVKAPEYLYGLCVDSFEVTKGRIKTNEFLADILLPHHVSYGTIEKMVATPKEIFDARRMMADKKYAIFCRNDSTHQAAYFVYEPNQQEYVIFDLNNDVVAERVERPVTLVRKTVGGVIKHSLYETLSEKKASTLLAILLSEIYAWSIDFYRIQKGDHFKIVYYEKQVEGRAIGVDKIEAAVFQHQGDPYYAFEFEQDGFEDFYDEEAKSLRKAFLKSPLKFGRISSGYTKRRFHPVQKRWKAHLGTDYAAPHGTPILSVGDGRIVEARRKKYNGKYVKIKHNGTYTTQYLHMSRFAKGIVAGTRVRQGQVIGYVGSTGLATGPHVCFRFWKNGVQVNHRREKLPASKPIKAAYREAFDRYAQEMLQVLEGISLEEPTPVVMHQKGATPSPQESKLVAATSL